MGVIRSTLPLLTDVSCASCGVARSRRRPRRACRRDRRASVRRCGGSPPSARSRTSCIDVPRSPSHRDPQDLVLRDAVDLPGRVGVQPRRRCGNDRREREPDEPLLVRDVADHVGDREDRGVLPGLRVDPADLAGQPLPVEDRAAVGRRRTWPDGRGSVATGFCHDRAACRLRTEVAPACSSRAPRSARASSRRSSSSAVQPTSRTDATQIRRSDGRSCPRAS